MNPEESQAQPSVISKLALLQIHHKQINSLLNVYKHKVAHQIPPLKRKQLVSLKSLPKIKRELSNKLQAESSTSLSYLHPKPFSTLNINSVGLKGFSNKTVSSSKTLNPKTLRPSVYEEKMKLQKLKEAIQVDRENKRKEAKEMKEANRLMRENVLLFRENVLQENIQRKKIVDARYKLINSSIINYKVLKKEYITSTYQDQINRQLKEISKKALHLKNLQTAYESKMLSMPPNKTMPVPEISEKDELADTNSHHGLTNIQKFLTKRDDANTFMTGVKCPEDC